MKKDEELVLPPGFRFHPTDEELVKHYLCRKCAGHTISVPIIADIDLYKFDPWQLPGMGVYGEKEWYFFTPRDRKYPNGSRPNRAAGTGYWKATGADKAVVGMGIKKALVFYAGKPPTGFKTNWIMHEYRLANVDRSSSANKRNNLRLDDWVLCRIYNKKGTIEKHYNNNVVVDQKAITEVEDEKPKLTTTFLHQPLPPPSPLHTMNDYMHHFDTSTCESVPRLMHTASHLQVLSAEFPCEIQSAPKWNDNLDYHHQLNYMDDDDGFQDYPFSSQMQQQYNNDQLQDMFMYMHKPFYSTIRFDSL